MRNIKGLWPVIATASLLPAMASAAPPAKVKATITASSTYEGESKHPAAAAFDGSLGTSWAEGKASAGKGEWIEIAWDKPQPIRSVSIWGGDFRGTEEWEQRNRVAKVKLAYTTSAGEEVRDVEIGDRFARKDVKIDGSAGVKKLRITLTDFHSGQVYDDTHIAEVAFDFPDTRPEVLAALEAWKTEKKYPEAEAAYAAARDAALAALRAGQEYEKNLAWLGDVVSRGAPFIVQKVAEICPPGFVLQHLPVEEAVVEAFGKLRDVRSVPWLEMAAVRASNRQAVALRNVVKEIQAWDQLEKAKNVSVPNWGMKGIAPGAFQARGEALGIDVTSRGDIVVADVGNNRVQRFTPDGRADTIWGAAESAITDRWFGQIVDPYASGSAAGKGAGEFSQPSDVAVGNYDYAAVIDWDKRVQVLDPEGKTLADFQVPSEYLVLPGHGTATPIATWWGDDFYFLLGNEVWGFSQRGEQKVRFTVEEDILAGVIADGKLLVRTAASRDIVEYAIQDGFRQGRFNKKPIEEDGSEDWDLATDAADNVYLLTDTGSLYVWNKKGKLLHQGQVSQTGLVHPRMAISGDVIYVLSAEKIGRLPNPVSK